MRMNISPINAFVNREVKRYAKMLSHAFDNVILTCARNKDKNGYNYKFHSSDLTHDLIFTLYDTGLAEFWKRRTAWRWRKNETSVIIAEWNAFADPFEVAISIQLRMYHTLRYYLVGDNNYHTNYKDIHSDTDYMLGMPEDEGSEFEHDDPDVVYIPGPSHEGPKPAKIDVGDTVVTETLKPRYIQVTEDDYLDEFVL